MTPCPSCGLKYRDFRCGYTTAKGAPATPNRVKAEAWTMHLESCLSPDAASFDPMAFAAPTPARGASGSRGLPTAILTRTALLRVATAPERDEWGGALEPEAEAFERDWREREVEAARILAA